MTSMACYDNRHSFDYRLYQKLGQYYFDVSSPKAPAQIIYIGRRNSLLSKTLFLRILKWHAKIVI